MTTLQQRSAGKKSARRFNSRINRHRVALVRELRRARKPLIPDSVLAKLAALNLPPNEFVYQACLEKLLRSV